MSLVRRVEQQLINRLGFYHRYRKDSLHSYANMAEEEDFSALPLADQFAHKNWKARKGGYETAVKQFDLAASENDPLVRQFLQDAGVWKGVVADSNVAAQQEGLGALLSFLNIAGYQGCVRLVRHRVSSIIQTPPNPTVSTGLGI
jgi:hypothetical protein